MNKKKFIFCKTIFYAFTLFLYSCQQDEKIEENSLENTEFHIEDNVLLGYSGSATDVVIPNSVDTISKYAFADSDAEIKKITIPSSVVHIDIRSFFGLSSLQDVVLEEGNPAFVKEGAYLLSRDGSVVFSVGSDELGLHSSSESVVFEFADQVDAQSYYEDGFQIVFYDTILSFREPTAKEANNVEITSERCRLYQIEGHGHTVTIPDILIPGDHICSFYRIEDVFVFTDYVGNGSGDTYIFSESGVWGQHNSEDISTENYNDAIFNLYRSEDGCLKFWCSPRKYLFTGSAGDFISYSVGRNELYRIEGSVSFFDGEPIFTSEEEVLLGEKYDEVHLELDFEMYHKNFSYTATPPWNTLDELFEYNAKHYEEFKNVLIE